MGWFWDTVTGAEQASGAELDRRTAELDARARERGAWTPANDAIVQEHRAQQEADTAQQTSSVIDSAVEGAQEGLMSTADAVRGGINSVASSAGKFVWSAIPGWLWVVGVGVVMAWAWSQGLLRRFLPK